jgi:hypothetical protein
MRLFCLVSLVALAGPTAWADGTVTSSGNVSRSKLAFLIPNLFGPEGLTLPNPNHEAHFDSAFQANFGPFNTAVASQLTSLPIPSPASGFTYTFDRSLGTYTRSAQSFGPILTERAETIGKEKFFVGFSFQNFTFDKIDNLDTGKVPSVFKHISSGNPAFAEFSKDLITTQNFLDIQLAQFTTFFTYGVTDRFDISVALPLIRTKLDVVSDAKIQRIGNYPDPANVHYFDNGKDAETFSSSGEASGIGDIIVRLKATAFKWKNGGMAVATDLRLPTGDEYDFLGSGALGIKPFIAISHRAGKVSPHVNAGYQWNDSSVLAGDVRRGTKGHLPNQFTWAAGADWGISPKFTVAGDLLGVNTPKAKRIYETNVTGANGVNYPGTEFRTAGLNTVDGALGLKVNPIGSLLVTFNVIFKLNDGGLRDNVTPLIGVSYVF